MPQREDRALARRQTVQRHYDAVADLAGVTARLGSRYERRSPAEDQLLVLRLRAAAPQLPFARAQPVQTGVHGDARQPAAGIVQLAGVFFFERLVGLQEHVLGGGT